MWQQFLSEPGCRATGGTRPTVLNLPRSLRRDQLPELEKWSRNLQDPAWRDAFTLEVLDRAFRNLVEESMRLHKEIEGHRQARAQHRTLIQTKLQRIRTLEASIHTLQSGLADERRRVQRLEHEVKAIQSSRSWKLLTTLSHMKSRISGSGK